MEKEHKTDGTPCWCNPKVIKVKKTMPTYNRDKQNFLSVGYHKGEMDFGVSCSVADLTYEQIKELREMIVVAIGQMEAMWARGQEEKREKPDSNKHK